MNNLPSAMGTEGNAGAVAFGGPQAAPAHFQVGAVGFGPAWSVEDSMAASIVRLEQENDELRAEVALLREEQKILAKGFPSPAKAAVIEGVEQQDLPAGVSRIGCHERPEPSPHFSDTPETDEAVERWRQGKINIFDEMERLERERNEARAQYQTTHLLAEALAKTLGELKAERDEARKLADSAMLEADRLRPQRNEAVEAICNFVNGQVWPAETWGNARYLRRLFEIAQAEGCK